MHILQLCSEVNKYVCFSMAGDIRFWDIRKGESTRVIQAMNKLTAFDVHNHADILAW